MQQYYILSYVIPHTFICLSSEVVGIYEVILVHWRNPCKAVNRNGRTAETKGHMGRSGHAHWGAHDRQGAGFFGALYILIILLKLSSGEILDLLSSVAVLAWVLLPLILVSWRFHVRFIDRITKAENQRLGEENQFLRKHILDLTDQLKQLRSGDES